MRTLLLLLIMCVPCISQVDWQKWDSNLTNWVTITDGWCNGGDPNRIDINPSNLDCQDPIIQSITVSYRTTNDDGTTNDTPITESNSGPTWIEFFVPQIYPNEPLDAVVLTVKYLCPDGRKKTLTRVMGLK